MPCPSPSGLSPSLAVGGVRGLQGVQGEASWLGQGLGGGETQTSGPRSKAAGAGVSAECRASGERLQGKNRLGQWVTNLSVPQFLLFKPEIKIEPGGIKITTGTICEAVGNSLHLE